MLRPAAGGPASWMIGLAIVALLSPTLARTPQSGDGAEVVLTALRGGVLHPPGFPLQAWIDRAVAAAAGDRTPLAIGLLGLIAHAIAGACVAETLRRLGVSAMGRVLGAAAFALFPPLWANAVQPELFAFGHAFIAATMLAGVRAALAPPRAASVRGAAGLGVLAALGSGTHPVAAAAIPAWLVAVVATLRARPGRGARAAAIAGGLLIPSAALYSSLPWLRTSSFWPDWGALRTMPDVIHHSLRMDYGTFTMTGLSGPASTSGFEVWTGVVGRCWNAVLVLAAIGAIAIGMRPVWRRAALPIGGVLLASLVLLGRARLPVQSYTASELARLGGPATLALAAMIGLGWQALRDGLSAPLARRGLDALVILVTVAWLVTGWREADVSHDRTLELYLQGVAAELPRDAVYIAEGDVESFYGVPDGGGRRWPIATGQLALETYRREVAPHLEPRVFRPGRTILDRDDLLRECRRLGLTVAGTNLSTVMLPPAQPELRGLVILAPPDSSQVVTRETAAAAVRLGPLTAALPDLPAHGHAFSRFYTLRFARAYSGAALALLASGDSTVAVLADSVESALQRYVPGRERRRRLEAFAAAAHASGF